MKYTELKHSDNGMPTWDAYLGVILQIAAQKERWTSAEIRKEEQIPDQLLVSFKNGRSKILYQHKL